MKKLFKLFVTLMMVAVLGIGVSVPSMATECETTDTELEVGSTTEMESRDGSQVGGMSGKTTIKEGIILGTCYVPTRAKSIEATITGVNGIVILQFDNLDTGDHRSFTAIGGQTNSLEYTSSMDVGNWQCSVRMCANNAWNCNYDIKFYR